MLGFLDIGGTDERQAIYRRTGHSSFAGSGVRAVSDGCMRKHNSSEQSFYRWKNEFGGMGVSEVKRCACQVPVRFTTAVTNAQRYRHDNSNQQQE